MSVASQRYRSSLGLCILGVNFGNDQYSKARGCCGLGIMPFEVGTFVCNRFAVGKILQIPVQ